MKIAILGSAPSSLSLAPIGNPSYKIWGCSPGVYSVARRCDAWFELHRPEFGAIGVPESQKQWFSPEYVAWMANRVPGQCPVWMQDVHPAIPASQRLDIERLTEKYGSYFWTSSISIMIACAIEDIQEDRAKRKAVEQDRADHGLQLQNQCSPEPDEIALFGVDMSANEEYGYQRAGCQHFLLIAADLGIRVNVPPESDLLRPMPIYGISEGSPWMIKSTIRKRELETRKAQAEGQMAALRDTVKFLEGALDDLNYNMLTWGEDRIGMGPDPSVYAAMPKVRADVMASLPPPAQPHPAIAMEGELVTLLTGIGQRREGEDTITTVRRLLSERENLLDKRNTPPPKKRRR